MTVYILCFALFLVGLYGVIAKRDLPLKTQHCRQIQISFDTFQAAGGAGGQRQLRHDHITQRFGNNGADTQNFQNRQRFEPHLHKGVRMNSHRLGNVACQKLIHHRQVFRQSGAVAGHSNYQCNETTPYL